MAQVNQAPRRWRELAEEGAGIKLPAVVLDAPAHLHEPRRGLVVPLTMIARRIGSRWHEEPRRPQAGGHRAHDPLRAENDPPYDRRERPRQGAAGEAFHAVA